MVEKPRKKELIVFIIALAFIAVCLWYFVESVSAHGRHGHHQDIDPCQVQSESAVVLCITPTEEATPSASPTVTTEPSPTAGESAEQGGTGVSDGRSDGRSDGKSSCPECTKAPKDVNGQVLSSQVGWK